MLKPIVAFLALMIASPAMAAWHLYLVPVVVVKDAQGQSSRRPKYAEALKVEWKAIDFGAQPVMLVAADLSDAQDKAATANADVTRIPDNLDSIVTVAARASVQKALESRNIPGSWVTIGTTYRTIVRTFISVSFLLQRYGAVAKNYGPVITGSVTLSTTFSALPLAARNNLLAAAKSLQIDTSGFTGNSTLRQILKGVADQSANRQRQLGGVTI